MTEAAKNLTALQQQWRTAWPAALQTWSRFVQLSEPKWCFTKKDEEREQLSGSFAMIRLLDHTVVISLRQVAESKLESFAHQVLAHEIGHHVYCPADLTDNARVLARIRVGLPTKEQLAPMISNLYTDLLINDRLQRSSGLDMAAVYRAIDSQSTDRMWTLYLRIYEILWSLPTNALAHGPIDARMNQDANLGARLIRSYAREWLDGAGRFACLCLPYLLEDDGAGMKSVAGRWHDTKSAGAGAIPDGITVIDPEELNGAIHPAEDPDLSGVAAAANDADTGAGPSDGTGLKSIKTRRQPFEYADLLKAAGVEIPEELIVARYYRELALPHLVRFPMRESAPAADEIPEGLDTWDIGSPVDEVDWLATVMASPTVIAGVTTRRREYGSSPGPTPERAPIDLYLGVDCSGSMSNPAKGLSYPILAGAVIALSALRTGSRVMVALSGEPGKTITTDGFVRDENLVLKILTSYLGTGMTFGIHRLAETFDKRPPNAPPAHILILTDNDIFWMLSSPQKNETGWDVASRSLIAARGGGTMVLQLPEAFLKQAGVIEKINPGCARLQADGWTLAPVASMEQLLEFARQFSRRSYEQPAKAGTKR